MQTMTADGRDLTDNEWRSIPGFAKYEITRDGDVRNTRTRKLLTESANPKTGAYYYTLYRDTGGTTCRNYQTLINATYAEAVPTGAASTITTEET